MTPPGRFAARPAFSFSLQAPTGFIRPDRHQEMRLRPLDGPGRDRTARARRRDRRRAGDRAPRSRSSPTSLQSTQSRAPRPARHGLHRAGRSRAAACSRSRAAAWPPRAGASRSSCSGASLVVGSIAVGIVLEDRAGHAAAVRLHPAADLRRDLLPGRRHRDRRLARARLRRGSAALTGQSAADMTFQLMALAFAAVMGVWQAYGRERRAAQLVDRAPPRAAATSTSPGR